MECGERNRYMDFLKGIAILATVAGHLLTDIPAGNTLFNVIYSFHMPLLFFVSAYIEEENRRKYIGKEKNMLSKRAIGLLMPYFSWSLLYTYMQRGIIFELDFQFWKDILLGNPYGGLWFLPVLFGLKILHYLYWKICNVLVKPALWKSILAVILLESITAILALIIKHTYLVNMLSYAIPYFFAVFLVDFDWVRRIIESEWLRAFALLIYILVFPLFSFYNTHWTTQVIRIGLSLCVIIVCWKLQGSWKESSFSKVLCLFGKYSLAVYLMHGCFTDGKLYLSRLNSGFIVALSAVAMSLVIAIICVAVAKLIETSSWWTRILFGK